MDIPLSLAAQIAALGEEYGAERIVLFGSRARGDNSERSDIDLAVFGLSDGAAVPFCFALDDLPTLLKFDVAVVHDSTDARFLKKIERDGVTLYGKDS